MSWKVLEAAPPVVGEGPLAAHQQAVVASTRLSFLNPTYTHISPTFSINFSGDKEHNSEAMHNSSSVYRQMIRSIYESSLARLLHVENQSVTASREAPVFDKYSDPVESPQDSLYFITNALAKNTGATYQRAIQLCFSD